MQPTTIVNTSTGLREISLSVRVKPFRSKCVLYGNGCYSGTGILRAVSSQISVASAGCRIGELLGLEIKDLLDNFTTIRIIQQAKGKQLTPELKTANSVRFVDISPEVAALLKEFVAGRTTGLVFPNRVGRPLNPSNIRNRVIHPLLRDERTPDWREPHLPTLPIDVATRELGFSGHRAVLSVTRTGLLATSIPCSKRT